MQPCRAFDELLGVFKNKVKFFSIILSLKSCSKPTIVNRDRKKCVDVEKRSISSGNEWEMLTRATLGNTAVFVGKCGFFAKTKTSDWPKMIQYRFRANHPRLWTVFLPSHYLTQRKKERIGHSLKKAKIHWKSRPPL